MQQRQLLVTRLLLSEAEKRESIEVLRSIEWQRLPELLRALGRTVCKHEAEAIVATDIGDIRSCVRTRQVLSEVGDRSRGVVPALCSEIVGWIGVRLSLVDVASQYAEQQKRSGHWRW